MGSFLILTISCTVVMERPTAVLVAAFKKITLVAATETRTVIGCFAWCMNGMDKLLLQKPGGKQGQRKPVVALMEMS